MAVPKKLPMVAAATVLSLAFLMPFLLPTEAQIGVCYGMLGDNLPSRQDVVKLYQSNGIGAMRIYWPDQPALQALQGSGIKLILDVPRESIQSLGSDPSAAMQWVQTNVVPFASSIKYIAVGNEVHQYTDIAPSVGPAMQNVLNALNSANLGGQIKVSTAIDTSLISNPYPPSGCEINDMSFMGPIVDFLKTNGSPLLVNVFPYIVYAYNKQVMDVNYGLFTSPRTILADKATGLQYQNLFDVIVDSVYTALSKAGAPDIAIVVSESGWPSDGDDAATVANAETYYRELIKHVKQGTLLKPGQGIETYLFAMFDENNKSGEPTEQHYGLFYPNQQPKYQLNFN